MNKRSVGGKYESICAQYLKENGVTVLEQNFYCRFGEIDLIGKDGEGVLLFVEIKYRANSDMGHPAQAVDRRKIRKICKSADYYRMKEKIDLDTPCRFDVISVLGDEISWIQNAFEYVGKAW